jgi:Putative MetA-pathway of phenol degradation
MNKHNFIRGLILNGALICSFITGFSQPPLPVGATDASDPANMKSLILLDLESYFFHQPAQFYALRIGYTYGLRNGRHLFGLSVPFVHSIFDADRQGFENTTGIGDLRMWYMAALATGKTVGLSKVSPYFEATAPTGEYLLGRGAGTWLYKPGMIFTYTVDPQITLYPEIRFQFSGKEANSNGGTGGIPDIEDPKKDGKLQDLTVQVPLVIQLESAQAWLAIDVQYQQSFTQNEYFLFLRTDFGKMINERTAASLSLTKFIAGQPRLNVMAQAGFQFFLR